MDRKQLSDIAAVPIFCDRGNPFPTPGEILRAGTEAIRLNTGYTDPLGIMELRQSIADHLFGQLAITYQPETEIIVTAGASPAIFAALLALTDPGDDVLVPDPGWPTYSRMITTLGRHPVCYATSPFRPADAAESAGGPRAIIVNSPHNPVGMVLDHSQLRQLEAICAAHPRLTIISDETYEGLVFDGTTHTSPATLPGLTGTTIVVRSFSKTYSMPGWRVGYLAAPEPLTAKIRRFHLAMNSFSPAMSQHTARWALDQGDAVPRALCARYEANRNYLAARLRDIAGFSCVPSQGTLYLFPALSGNTRTAADKLARCYGVHLCPGEMFGSLGQGHLRICLALEDDVLRELCRRIVMFAEDF